VSANTRSRQSQQGTDLGRSGVRAPEERSAAWIADQCQWHANRAINPQWQWTMGQP